MTAAALRTLLVAGLLVGATQGCSLLGEHSQIVRGPDGTRTFTVIREIGGSPMLCAAFGVIDPVHGTLQGAAGAREPAWIVSEDGQRLSVIWPEGFSVRFEPDVSLYNEVGRLVGTAGDSIELGQTTWDSATGTYDDPYLAQGIVFNSCYPFVK